MNTTLKKIGQGILVIILLASFILMFSECENMWANAGITLGAASMMAICGRILDKQGFFGEDEEV